ncbi:MAG: type III-B CRISPR module-associated protein Cmr5 [Syntrophomonadaceae bacterium]|nr:type III-B CRISPR module-associated protein Cmr5 [Syntrophomonadaceae bacterium]
MRKKQVEDYIPKALVALESCEIMSKGLIPKEFKGYIASFGAAIITNGLLPAIAFYQDQGEAKKKRNSLMKAILYIIDEDGHNHQSLMVYVNDRQQDRAEIKDKIMAAAVALKLAMRTFEFTEKEADDNASA